MFAQTDKAIDEVPQIIILDGGFSSQLSRHVGDNVEGTPLWTSRFLKTHPDEVVNTHLDFLRAGANVISTNTYQAWVGGFVKHFGVTPEEGRLLIARAVELAKQARTIFLEESQESGDQKCMPLIAGSLGPYGSHLHNASEYDGSYVDTTSLETMRDWHKSRIECLFEAGVDLLALETVPCQKEAEMLVELIKDYPSIKAWLSFSCKDDKMLAHGEDFKAVVKKCWEANPNQLIAVGVNCCSPHIVANLFKGINDDRQNNPIPFIVYPNSGENFNAQIGWVDRDKCKGIEHFVDEWLDLGVRYVGGCCRTYDSDISNICTQVQNWCEKKRYKNMGE